MVRTRRTKKVTKSKKIRKENGAADGNIAETKTSDTGLLNEDQNKVSTPCDDKVELSHDQEKNEEEEETMGEERKIAACGIVDETTTVAEIIGDNLVEEDQRHSKDGGLHYLKDEMFDGVKENCEGDDQEIGASNNNARAETFDEEKELKEGDAGSEEQGEGSKEGDEEPKEVIEEFRILSGSDDLYVESEEGDDLYLELEDGDEELEGDEEFEEGDDLYLESEDGDEELEGDEEFEEGDEESEEGDEQLEKADKRSEQYQEKENEEGKKGNVEGVGGASVEPHIEKVEASLKEAADKSPGRKRKKLLTKSSKKVESGDKTKALKKKPKRRVATMGMIFMCSSTTKSDCYRYRVLGLPANKKDVVEKIYNGMRLFLYDVDLKLLNGIYKAVGPGGYNIEPEAFKSQFPSQVRFTILDDCLPVAEEKFKKVIKDNYYTNTKFDCLLNSKQVRSLCKLFLTSSNGQQRKRVVRSSKEARSRIVLRNKPRKQRADEAKQHAVRGTVHYREHPRKRPRKAITSVVSVPSSALSRGYDRVFEAEFPILKPHSESRDRHLDDQGVLLNRGGSYRDARYPPIEHFDSYRDGREHRDYYRDRRDIPSDRRDPYRDGRDSHLQRRSPYRDGRDLLLQRRSPYRDERDSYLQRRSPYRYERDPYLQRRSPYRDGQDPYIQRRSPYRERRTSDLLQRSSYGEGRDSAMLRLSPSRNKRDLILDRPDPYQGGQDPYPEHGSPYRNRRDTFTEHERRDPYSDMRNSYLQHPRPFKDAPLSEPRDTYRMGPISDRHDPYRDARLAQTHDPCVRIRDPPPTHLETRRLPDIGSRDANASYHLSYAEPKLSTEYPSRAGLEQDYRLVRPMTDLYSSRGRLPDYSYRRA